MYYYFNMRECEEWFRGSFDYRIPGYSKFFTNEDELVSFAASVIHEANTTASKKYNDWRIIVWDDNLNYKDFISNLENCEEYTGLINLTDKEIDILDKINLEIEKLLKIDKDKKDKEIEEKELKAKNERLRTYESLKKEFGE